MVGMFFMLAIWFQAIIPPEEQFTQLAHSFLQGKLYLSSELGATTDAVIYQGKIFWALGPLPAVLLLPATLIANWLHFPVSEGAFHFLVGVLVFVLVYALSRRFRFSSSDSLLLALGFCFASPFIGVFLIPWSWFFAQMITVGLLLFALYEWQGRKRFWLIGMLLAGVFATRFTAGVGVLFFILSILSSHFPFKQKAGQLLQLCLPLLVSVLLLAGYNYARFDSPWETGYSWQSQVPEAAAAREYGVFSWQHVPSNLYYLFFNTPHPVFTDAVSQTLEFPFLHPDPWGMSLLITSPYLLYLFLHRPRGQEEKWLWVTTVAVMLPLLFFYGSGYFQFGYRYALDFFPFLFFLLLHQYMSRRQTLSMGFKTLLILPALWNAYLIVGWLL